MNENDPKTDAELETLLESMTPDERDTLLEDHRQLEKDLLRLADPLPPADFVHRVMQKVAAAPAPAPAPRELAVAGLIMVSAVTAAVFSVVTHGAGVDGVGLSIANFLVHVRLMFSGLFSAFEAVWSTAAVPMAAALAAMLFVSVAALKRIGTEVKVTS
jgi:hypothetical protein